MGDDEEEEQSEEKDATEESEENEESEETETNDEVDKSEDKEENDAEPEKKEEKEDIVGDTKETEDAAEQEQEDEEDPSNLQLAWEMLELAKMVLVEQLEDVKLTAEARSALEKRLFETYLILGEVSLENENYPQAVDLTVCLEKQKAALPEDSRNIAVTYYQLGIALGFNMKYEEAIEKLEMAIGVLKKRIDNLTNKTESVDESKANDAFYTREKEIKEIESLIPEIKEKITDTNEMREESLRKI